MKLTAEQIAEGWILNNGTNPIKDGQKFDVMRKFCISHNVHNAKSLNWDKGSLTPIIAYRIISETPTIEQVKEHFKDALIVESFWEGKVFSTFNNFHFWNGEAYCSDEEGKDRLMWGKKHGYAKIIEYKKTEKEMEDAPKYTTPNKLEQVKTILQYCDIELSDYILEKTVAIIDLVNEKGLQATVNDMCEIKYNNLIKK